MLQFFRVIDEQADRVRQLIGDLPVIFVFAYDCDEAAGRDLEKGAAD